MAQIDGKEAGRTRSTATTLPSPAAKAAASASSVVPGSFTPLGRPAPSFSACGDHQVREVGVSQFGIHLLA